MEESGENWPSDFDWEGGDDVKDFVFDEEEIAGDDDEDHSFAETVDPMMEEDTDRKGRQRELTERLLALLTPMPGLKKMDDASILAKICTLVKQLQQRVRELEQQEVEPHICSNKTTTSCDANPDYFCGTNEILLEVTARVSEEQVLVTICCEKQKGIMVKILTQLQNLHLSVVNSNILGFGKPIHNVIIIVAKMDDGYNMTVDELVKTLRTAILTP